MDTKHRNATAHSLSDLPSRRAVLRGLAGVGPGLAALLGWPAGRNEAEAGKKRRRKKRTHKSPPSSSSPPPLPPPFNEYGCLDVGQPCQGDSGACCSGICELGTSRCAAHNTDICYPDTDQCTGMPLGCNTNTPGCVCMLTTGNAGFCGDFSGLKRPGDYCRFCSQDTDCQEEFGPGAACVVLAGICTPACAATGRTACMPRCA